MATSEPQKKCIIKYRKNKCKQFGIVMSKSEGEIVEKFCKLNKYSKNAFGKAAFFEKIERETGKTIEELQKDYEKLDDPRNIDDLDVLEEYTFKDKNINNINDIEDIEGIKNIENIEDIEG